VLEQGFLDFNHTYGFALAAFGHSRFFFFLFFFEFFLGRLAVGATVAIFIHLVVTSVEGFVVKGHCSSWW